MCPTPSCVVLFVLQDLVPQCCFLLVSPGEQSFLWVGKSFATGLLQVSYVWNEWTDTYTVGV